jgi:hypothetical protein
MMPNTAMDTSSCCSYNGTIAQGPRDGPRIACISLLHRHVPAAAAAELLLLLLL